MNDQGNVNSQIVDSVADVVLVNGGQAPSHAFGMLDAVMTDTLGMAMYNAVSRQQGASMIGSAAVTTACARMVSVPFPSVPVSPPAPVPPPVIEPLDPPPAPPPMTPAMVIAAANAQAEAAIALLQSEAQTSSANAADANASLAQLVVDATPPPPPPAPPKEKS